MPLKKPANISPVKPDEPEVSEKKPAAKRRAKKPETVDVSAPLSEIAKEALRFAETQYKAGRITIYELKGFDIALSDITQKVKNKIESMVKS